MLSVSLLAAASLWAGAAAEVGQPGVLAHRRVEVPKPPQSFWDKKRPAIVDLYADAGPGEKRHMCSYSYGAKQRRTPLRLESDVCLSGDFKLDNNVLYSNVPDCPNDPAPRVPYLAIYPRQGCVGEHSHPTWHDPKVRHGFNPARCIGQAVFKEADRSAAEFSFIFRCGPWENASVAEGADQHIFVNKPVTRTGEEAEWNDFTKSGRPVRPDVGVTSLTACDTPGHVPAQIDFEYPDRDVCYKVQPGQKLKIYKVPRCVTGRNASLTVFRDDSCYGMSQPVRRIDEDMLASTWPLECLDILGEQGGSYAFTCSGSIIQDPSTPDPYIPPRPKQYFSAWLKDHLLDIGFGFISFLATSALIVLYAMWFVFVKPRQSRTGRVALS